MQNYIRYDVTKTKVITIGVHKNDLIKLEKVNEHMSTVLIIYEEQKWHIIPNQSIQVFCNNKIVEVMMILEDGDHLHFDKIDIIIQKDYFDIKLLGTSTTHLKSLGPVISPYNEIYPNYHRSPRIIYTIEKLNVHIESPTNIPSKPIQELWKIIITPLSTMLLTIIIGIVSNRSLIAYLGGMTTLITSIISFIAFMKKQNNYKKEMREIKKNYIKYLISQSKQLKTQIDFQKQSLNYHLPKIEVIEKLVEEVSHRIYERMYTHSDFLTYRIGSITSVFALEIKDNLNELDNKKDVFKDLISKLKQEYAAEQRLPYALKLGKGALGYVGVRRHIIEQLQLMLLQLAVFHSYHDLRFIIIFPEIEKSMWDFIRWLPHVKIPSINLRSFIYDTQNRDHILRSLYQIFRKRKQQIQEGKEIFLPQYVIFITDFELIRNHNIVEFISSESENLGITLIYVDDYLENLPEFVKTVIKVKDRENGILLLENNSYQNKEILLEHFPINFNKEQISRSLAPLNHQLEFVNIIPDTITFLEMYNVESIEALKILERWKNNAPHKSLAVPIGWRGKNDIVYLDLHECAHGPHGLIAGTTGSGKSEIIQSFILSLAINFHPHDVAFLLIDYKGGGMANLFKRLPHHLGSITNLDGAESMRALISIKAELKKRQKLFSEYDVNHINQYQKLYKEDIVIEPMPHLFLITDEFAELKMEQPEFMKELVSIARIGRSLGIHLILATQKPTGIVDEQIWSNSKFKICLKVQNTADSNEVIKTADAASITNAGRGYLQVGNNEVYELFQSAWSGAEYEANIVKDEQLDETIYWINELGQYEIISNDFSELDTNEYKQQSQTELEAIIIYLEQVAEKNAIKKLSSPWLPPLAKKLFVYQKDFVKSWLVKKLPLKIEVGILDQPNIQRQNPFIIDLTKNAHMLIISSPGYGKSTTIQTCIMQLCRSFHPEQLHIYLIDFGINGLLSLKDLPHIADAMKIDETEKIGKFTRHVMLEIKERKHLLSEYSVASLTQYEKSSKNVLPDIVIVIDNMDALKDAELPSEFEQNLNQIAREGATLGIHLIISATRENAIRLQLLSNISIRLIQYMMEHSEITALVGRSEYAIEACAGRGLIKLEEPTLFQIGMPAKGETVLEIINNIKKEASEMQRLFNGQKPLAIPMMPEILTREFFNKIESVKRIQYRMPNIPIGIDYEFVEAVPYNLMEETVIVMTDSISKTYNFVTHILIQIFLKNPNAVFLLGSLREKRKFKFLQIVEVDEMEQMVEKIVSKMKRRKKAKINTFEYYLITNISFVFQEMSELLQKQLIQVMMEAMQYNMYFIVIGEYSIITNSYLLKQMMKTKEKIILLMKMSEQNIVSVEEKIYNEPRLLIDDGYLISGGYATKFRIPTVD